MTPIQKLNSFFINKMQFEREFANFGFRFNDTLNEEIKELKKSNEFEKEVINKRIFLECRNYFILSIIKYLGELEQEVNDKVNVVGQNDLKSEFVFSNIQNLIKLLERIELIFKEYPIINMEKSLERFYHFMHYSGIKNKESLDIRTSDDILEEIVSTGKKISPVPKNDLIKFYDFEYSDVYIGFLIETSKVITNSIQSIISENNQILHLKFNISDESPFLIQKEQIGQNSIGNKNIKYKTKHYVLTYIIECYAKGEIPPRGEKIKLEKIGNEKMGVGKGNTFYKVFSQIINKDFNIERDLIEIGGDDWRKIIKNLSKEHDKIETYLQSKEL